MCSKLFTFVNILLIETLCVLKKKMLSILI